MPKIEISKVKNQALRELAGEIWRTVETAPYHGDTTTRAALGELYRGRSD